MALSSKLVLQPSFGSMSGTTPKQVASPQAPSFVPFQPRSNDELRQMQATNYPVQAAPVPPGRSAPAWNYPAKNQAAWVGYNTKGFSPATTIYNSPLKNRAVNELPWSSHFNQSSPENHLWPLPPGTGEFQEAINHSPQSYSQGAGNRRFGTLARQMASMMSGANWW